MSGLYCFGFGILVLGHTGYPGNEPAPFVVFPDYQQGTGVADGTVGTGNDTDEQDQDEVMNGTTANQEQGEQHE